MKGLHKVSRRYRCAACRPLHFSHVPAPLSPVPLYFSSLSLLRTALHYLNAWNRLPWCHWGRTIRKVMGGGGWGKKQKKIHARETAKKKNHAKKKVKKKIHAEGRFNCDFFSKSEFLSESLSFRNQQYYQAQYE